MSRPPDRPDPDLRQLHRALEALLRSPRAGVAVAETMSAQAAERTARTVIAEMRARRAQQSIDRDADRHEAERFGQDKPPSPWARPA